MEQPPGSIDDLQPQDLSMSSSASVIDLTKKGEGCISSKVPSVDTLQAASNWCPISSASNPSLTSDILLQSGEDHIRPDIALSNTTVTVSYVSRSHVISSHESLSQHLPLCGVPAVRKLHLCPPGYPDTGIRETGIPLDQQYSDEGDRPVVLATQTELFHTLSAAQVGQQSFGSDLMQDTNEVNGGAVSPDWVLNEHSLPQAKAKGLENGQIDSCSSSGVCAEWSPETGTPAAGEDEDTGGAEVLFLMSKTKDSVLLPDGLATGDLCSQERNFISPLDDPVSPSPTSQDDVEEMFVLPQASSSPSGDNSYPQMENESAWDGTSTRCTNPLDSLDGAATAKFQSSDKDTAPVQKQKAPVINLTVDDGTSNNVESRTATSHMNGNAEILHMPLEGKKLAACSGRGTQSEAATVDMNLNSQFTNDEEDTPLKRNRMRKAKVLVTAQQAAKVQVTKRKAADTSTDNHQDSTSDSEANSLRKLPSSTRPKSPRLTAKKNIFPPPERLSLPLVSSAAKRNVSPLSATSPKKSWGEAKGRSAGLKTPSTTKRKGGSTPRKRRRKRRPSPTSNMFSPKEPEIKLRYINFKEEKRQCGSVDNFSPFVHVERQPQQQPSLCTVINYPEEVSRATQPRSRQPTQPGGFVCTAVPSTSCLQLGRMAVHGQHQRVLVCCLCGLSANAMYLGDLHGPYYPEGFQSAAKSGEAGSERLQCKQGDECDDSDASSRSIRTRRRKRAILPRSQSSGITLKGRDLRTKRRRSTDGPSASPSKWARPDAGSSTTCSAEDWYSPPLLPADPCEFWLHEDCGIWSTGVFLVGGRVYGLKEAVKAAQETTCSACRHPGATLGCFFKSCPYKYHYRCALESDCVLVEENFSMKCKKHKNKTFKAPPGNRLDDR